MLNHRRQFNVRDTNGFPTKSEVFIPRGGDFQNLASAR